MFITNRSEKNITNKEGGKTTNEWGNAKFMKDFLIKKIKQRGFERQL